MSYIYIYNGMLTVSILETKSVVITHSVAFAEALCLFFYYSVPHEHIQAAKSLEFVTLHDLEHGKYYISILPIG